MISPKTTCADSHSEPDFPDLRPRIKPWPQSARLILFLITIVWATVAGTGLWWLWGYENAPGQMAIPPDQWPSNSRIQLAHNEPTLIVLAHPHCPCTRASIGELDKIMALTHGSVRAYVLFVKPEGFPDDWVTTDIWKTASAIPGVTVIRDRDGAQARLFGAATSGQTLLYNTHGRLLFSGGITAARGHSGDNAGQSAIVAIVNEEVSGQTETSVFGCPLFNPDSECPASIDETNKH